MSKRHGKDKHNSRARRAAPINRFDSLLSDELNSLRQQLESVEEMTDEELEAIEKLLEDTEPARINKPVPSSALTKEAMIAVYGHRYDNYEHLWCKDDAIQRQQSRAALEDNRRTDLRTGRVEVVVIGPDGEPRIEERAIVQGAAGAYKVIGSGKMRLFVREEEKGGQSQ